MLILFFCSLGSKHRTNFYDVFCVRFFARFFEAKPQQVLTQNKNSEPQKVYAHDALTNASIQCVENKMQVRKAAKLYNIPHTTLRDRLSGRVHIDSLLFHIETVLFSSNFVFYES